MLDITNLLPKIKFIGPIKRRRYRKYFTKYLLGYHPEGLEYSGLIFKGETETDDDYSPKETLKVRIKETNKLIYSNGRFCKWSQPIRQLVRHFIYAQGWAYYLQRKEEARKCMEGILATGRMEE